MTNKKLVIAVVLAVFLISACGKQNKDYKNVADNLAEIMIPLDQAGALYEEGMDAVEDYLDGRLSEAEVHSILLEKEEEIQAMQEDFTGYQIPDQIKGVLKNCQIDAVEYQDCADERVQFAAEYVQNLDFLDQYCQIYGEQEKEEVRVAYERELKILEAEKGYHYYHINYFCAPWDEQAVSYVQENLIDKLTVNKSEYFAWESDRDKIEKIVMSYLDKVEKCLYELKEDIERKKMELESYQQP